MKIYFQLKYSDLYDVPRKLLAPQEFRAGRQKIVQVCFDFVLYCICSRFHGDF